MYTIHTVQEILNQRMSNLVAYQGRLNTSIRPFDCVSDRMQHEYFSGKHLMAKQLR